MSTSSTSTTYKAGPAAAQRLAAPKQKARFGHAVVIGGSIAGLTAAGVLSDHFTRVTIVDRDSPPDRREFRRGVPQTRHAHRLLPRGQMILEQQFPGLVDELRAWGAITVEKGTDIAFDYDEGWRAGPSRPEQASLSCSRPLLESALYRRVASIPGITFMHGYEAAGLMVDDAGERVTGLRLNGRGSQIATRQLRADLVVDASGRHSKAPQWLDALGYAAPEEWSVNAVGGYATRIYQRPDDYQGEWKAMYVAPTPPDGTRGGIIIPIEGNRWHVTLIGLAGDYPPHDEEGFLDFARSLPTPRFYEALQAGVPLTRPKGFRGTASRVRRYDTLPRYLEGFLVLGDAAYILNPVYAQGMTAAMIGSRALDKTLARQPRERLAGLAPAFQKKLSRSLNRLWHTVTAQDWQWPATTVTDNSDAIYLN